MRSKPSRGGQAWAAAVGAALALASVGCGPEQLEGLELAEGAKADAGLAQAGAGLTGDEDTPLPPPDCLDCEPPEPPRYTLKWKAQLLSLKCNDPSDSDGLDEAFLVAEVTGDHAAETIWGPNYMGAGTTVDFNPASAYPPPLRWSSTMVGSADKLVALWDDSTGWFDAEEQIGWVGLISRSGIHPVTLSGAGGSYELRYQVVSTGCTPGTEPCPINP